MMILLGTAFSTNEAPNELYMSSSVIRYFGRYYNSLKLYIGTGKESDLIHHNFQIALGRSDVLLGDKDKVKWGVDCGQDEPNKASTCMYKSVNTIPWNCLRL